MNDPTQTGDQWLLHRAHEIALKAARDARDTAATELPPNMAYLDTVASEAWKPHPWVIDAIIAAMKERDTENDLVQAAMVDQHESHCKHLVATTTLAVLEASGVNEVAVDIEKQRTISDRYDLRYEHFEAEGKVVMTLVVR